MGGREGGEERGVCEEGLQLQGPMKRVCVSDFVECLGGKLTRYDDYIYVLSFSASGNHCSDGSGGAGRRRDAGP